MSRFSTLVRSNWTRLKHGLLSRSSSSSNRELNKAEQETCEPSSCSIANELSIHNELERQAQEIAQLRKELQYAQYVLTSLRDELFDVPTLPPLQFMVAPLENRLESARQEVASFVSGCDAAQRDEQYLLMQNMFRGSADQIRQQLATLLESISIPDHLRRFPIVEIGCGRGELLDILRERNLHGIGIDTSPLMVAKLKQQNFKAILGDGVEQLLRFPDNSLSGVIAVHVIEHFQPLQVTEFLGVAFRKLMPNGFVLLETPNPFCAESLSFFYTDDTHVRPIQPFQLAFLVENAGFAQSRAHFSSPVPVGRKQALANWLRYYQNHGIVAFKPNIVSDSKTNAA